MKKKHALASTLVLVAIVALLGPRVNVDIVLDEVMLPDNLDLYLAESEARFDDITQGTEKAIMWAGDTGEKNRYIYRVVPWFFSNPARTITLGRHSR